MFGKKKEEIIATNRVPVYNVPNLPCKYEPVRLVHAIIGFPVTGPKGTEYEEIIAKLGEIGHTLGADAVIGLSFDQPGGAHLHHLHAFGTAIKYVE